MKKVNRGIRLMARGAGIPLWAVAQKMGISEPTLSRWLRVPLSPEQESRIMDALLALEKEVSADE